MSLMRKEMNHDENNQYGRKETAHDIRVRAKAISEAADIACNQWNGAKNTQSKLRMGHTFQAIWENLKNLSDDEFKRAEDVEKIEHLAVIQE